MVLLKTKTGFVRQQRAQSYPYFGNRFDLAQDPDRRHVSMIVEELRALCVLDHGLLNVPAAGILTQLVLFWQSAPKRVGSLCSR